MNFFVDFVLNGYFGICGLFPVFTGFYAGSVPVSSGNMGRFCGANVWLAVADCMANVDWGRFLGCGRGLSNLDDLVTSGDFCCTWVSGRFLGYGGRSGCCLQRVVGQGRAASF
jgi:hypothetical protein